MSKKNLSLEELCKHRKTLIEPEKACFQRCCALDESGSDKSEEKSDAVREWWLTTNAILWMFVRTRAQRDHELKPFPKFTLARLANISEDVGIGNIPRFIPDAAKGGRPLLRPERHAIGYAVAFIEAAKDSRINDRSPNKTIRETYNVMTRNTLPSAGTTK